MRLVVLVGHDPVHAVRVVAVQHVGGADHFHFLRAAGVHDRRRHAGADHHRDEAGIDAVAVRQAEGDVGQAAGGVDLELVAQRCSSAKTCWPAVPMAPIGMTSGSTTMSCGLMP
jgi:hypothetical protein